MTPSAPFGPGHSGITSGKPRVPEVITLYRAVGPKELELIKKLEWRAFPPRLPEQPIFYPVLSEDYAIAIARDWNVPESGAGYVTRFTVSASFLERYEFQRVGSDLHMEYWIPAEELEDFNSAIVGLIEVTQELRSPTG